MSHSQQFILPDLLSGCPLEAGLNPHCQEAGEESRAWILSFMNILSDRKRADIIQGLSNLLCSYAYCYAGYEEFRTTCDFVNMLFVLDELSDDQSGKDAKATGFSYTESMRNPDWDDGSVVAKITKDLRTRLLRRVGPNNFRRFLVLSDAWTQCVAREAELRERGEVLSMEEFIPLRRNNSGVPLCFALVEYILGIDLPESIYQNATFLKAYWAACDHVCWSNDVYSYNVEQSKGHTGNNVVTVLMKDRKISLQGACDYIGERGRQLMNDYLVARNEVRETVGGDAARFIDALGSWIVGNMEWSFTTTRYFGYDHDEVRRKPSEFPKEVDSDSDEE